MDIPSNNNNNMMRDFMSTSTNKVTELVGKWRRDQTQFQPMRSWSLFCDRSKFSFPKIIDLVGRIRSNVLYFQTNYITILLFLILYCIITDFMFLVILIICSAFWIYAFYWRQDPIYLFRHQISSNEKIIFLIILSLILFYYSSFGVTLFWLIGVFVTVVFAHATFTIPHEENDFDFNTSFVSAPAGSDNVQSLV